MDITTLTKSCALGKKEKKQKLYDKRLVIVMYPYFYFKEHKA